MSFDRPLMLLLNALVLPYLLFSIRPVRAMIDASRFFTPARKSAGELALCVRKSTLIVILGALSLCSVSIALSGPIWGHEEGHSPVSGAHVAFLLDISNSMLARDEKPSRLEAAREIVRFAVRARPDTPAALVLVRGGATILLPMSADAFAIDEALGFAVPDALTTRATDLGSGIDAAAKSFGASQGVRKILVLLSDGEDMGSLMSAAAMRARKQGIILVPVVFGGTVAVPVLDSEGRPVLTSRGLPAQTSAKPFEMDAIASDGKALKPSDALATLGALIDETIDDGRGSGSVPREKIPADRSGIFIMAALFFLVARIALSPFGLLR